MQLPKEYSKLSIAGATSAWICTDQGADDAGFDLTIWPDQWFDIHLQQCTQWPTKVTDNSTDEEIVAAHNALRKTYVERVFIMPILYFVDSFKDKEFNTGNNICFLLLQPIIGPQRGFYRRVGIMRASKISEEEMTLDTIKH